MPDLARHPWSLPAAGALAVASGYLIWGLTFGSRRLDIVHHTVRLPGLPKCWRGERIALLSDVQVGMVLGNEHVVARAVRQIVARRPAAVLLAGDFILHTTGDPADRIAAMADLLRPLGTAGLRTFAVLGNHDYQLPDDEPRSPPLDVRITRALSAAGITVLRNEAVALRPRRRGRHDAMPLYVVGLGEHRMQDDCVQAAFAGVPAAAPRIVLMHNPDTFLKLPPGAAPLAVAGHTHGAQIRFVPGSATPAWMPLAGMPDDLQRGAGWTDPAFGGPGNRLYITRGVGFSYVPVRINAPPELTFFRLRRA